MSRSLFAALAMAALTVALPALANGQGRYIIKFKNANGRAAVSAAGGQIVKDLPEVSAAAAHLPDAAVTALRNNPNIEYVEVDPKRYLTAETRPYGIDMVQAPETWSSATGAGRKVCVIDSGFYTGHADLQSTGVTGYPSNWNSDGCGHGTHVGGTIAALGNSNGVVGVLPNGVDLHIIRIFGDDCSWTYASDLVDAAYRCRDAGANVISMSLGCSGRFCASSTEQAAFDDLYNNSNILSIAAAGNDGNTQYSYPASYDSVVSVAAVDEAGAVASFSQTNDQVEVSAPGVQVLSTVPWATPSVTVGSGSYIANQIEGAATAQASGGLVDGGLCTSTSSAWSGKVVLCERGSISFYDKTMNVQNSGGAAAIIYNNVAGNFAGTLGTGSTSNIPAVTLSQEDGLFLAANELGASATVDSRLSAPGSGYEAWDGTSMATPHVSAVAALVWSYDTSWTNAQVRDALQATALDLGAAGRDKAYGFGLVQARAALDYLLGTGGGGGGGGTTNAPPTASFTESCADLSCGFTDTSTDSDGTVASWSWDFGDGTTSTAQHPSHAYAAGGTYTVTLTVTDDGGASDAFTRSVTVSEPASGGGISLSVLSYKAKGRNSADLSWSGAAGASVDVYRNGARLTTTPNDGAYTDNTGLRGGMTIEYQVCEAGTTTCSNVAAAIW